MSAVKRPAYLHKVELNDGISIVHHDKNGIDPEKVEEAMNAKYIGEFTVHVKGGGWANLPVSVFWTNKAHPQGSNYFGLYYNVDGQLMITDAIAVTTVDYIGVMDEATKEILYSAYRHDYQTYGDLVADGGRDYFRGSLHKSVKFNIKDGKIVLDLIEEPAKVTA